MGDRFRRGGVTGRWGMGSNDSIPGRRSVCCWGPFPGLATGGGMVSGGYCDWFTTWLRRLAPL